MRYLLTWVPDSEGVVKSEVIECDSLAEPSGHYHFLKNEQSYVLPDSGYIVFPKCILLAAHRDYVQSLRRLEEE